MIGQSRIWRILFRIDERVVQAGGVENRLRFRTWLAMLRDPEAYAVRGNPFAALGFAFAVLTLVVFTVVAQWFWLGSATLSASISMLTTWYIAVPGFLWIVLLTGSLGALGIFLSSQMNRLERAVRDYYDRSEIDHLSGVRNRRGFQTIMNMHFESCNRGIMQDMALIFFDIDHFKKINDTYGHNFGDDVIKAISAHVERNIRNNDTLGRWGGEEFAIVCPGTDLAQATRLADRLRDGISKIPFVSDGIEVQVTVSMGVTCRRPDDSLASIFARSDEMLYNSKHLGRNRVEGCA